MTQQLEEEAIRLVRSATDRGATLRLFGGTALKRLIKKELLHRPEAADIDCVGLKRQLPVLLELFSENDYVEDLEIRRLFGLRRRVFLNASKRITVDLCLDILFFARPIDVRKRLEIRSETLSVSDLLLSKLQPKQFTQKDKTDVVNLLNTFRPGRDEDDGEFDIEQFVLPCTRDWGLFRLVQDNLRTVCDFKMQLDHDHRQRIGARIQSLLDSLRDSPKSLRWKYRSMIGERARYWNEVANEPSQ